MLNTFYRMLKSKTWLVSIAAACVPLCTASALGPHELALIVNGHSQNSLEIANHYAALRSIPQANIIVLDLPNECLAADAALSPEQFRDLVYNPTIELLQKRNITDHVLAWAYSSDFPIRITTDPPMSLAGITFTRGQPPSSDTIRDGSYRSPLFLGPDAPGGPHGDSLSLEQFAITLGTNIPLPSMMLSFTAERGLTVDQSINMLKTASSADGLPPSGTVFFLQTAGDPRTDCRSWQFQPAITELKKLGVQATTLTNAMPPKTQKTAGVMAGSARVDTRASGLILPGAIAEHLTSFGAVFSNPDQTKITDWLRSGAAATAGTITEPYANWAKFPNARVFVHYASGCTALEALYESIRCPLQLQLFGDPLVKPWAQIPGVTLINLMESEADKPVKGPVEFVASSWLGLTPNRLEHLFLFDGRTIKQPAGGSEVKINTTHVFDGYHDLRVVPYAQGRVRHQGFRQIPVITKNRGRSVMIENADDLVQMDDRRPVRVFISATGEETPEEVALVSRETVLVRGAYSNGVSLLLDPTRLGRGPGQIQAVAVYPDQRPVRSAPLEIQVEPINRPPILGDDSIFSSTSKNKDTLLSIEAIDPEGDAFDTLWSASIPLDDASPELLHVKRQMHHGGLWEPLSRSSATLTPLSNTVATMTFDLDQPGRILQISCDLTFPLTLEQQPKGSVSVLFDYTSPEQYSFLTLDTHASAWRAGLVENNIPRTLDSRGIPYQPGAVFRITLRVSESGGTLIDVDGEPLFSLPLSLGPGRCGFAASSTPATIANVLLAPPSTVFGMIREEQGSLHLEQEHFIPLLRAHARDVLGAESSVSAMLLQQREASDSE